MGYEWLMERAHAPRVNRAGRQREPFFRFYRNVAPRVVSIPYETVTPPGRNAVAREAPRRKDRRTSKKTP